MTWAAQLGAARGMETQHTCLALSPRYLLGLPHGQTAVVAFYQRSRVLSWKMGEGVDRFLPVHIISYTTMEKLMDQQQVMRITKALADPTRFRILQAIAEARESCCSELATRFPVTQATCSQHLKVLTDAGLLTMRREGQFNYYRFMPDTLEAYRGALSTSFEGASSLP
jgi:ArsR family transcriptional regulator, arsenate/arsenite/antimonite-responsive transcriptional repressor